MVVLAKCWGVVETKGPREEVMISDFLEKASWDLGLEGWVGVDHEGKAGGSISDRGRGRP